MRKIINLNSDWLFYKDTTIEKVRENGTLVNLPHTWNATDGQEGGNDYFRGTCLHVKKLLKSEALLNDLCFLEIRGANSSADVYLNGEHLAHHDGGYSTWRVDLTSHLL